MRTQLHNLEIQRAHGFDAQEGESLPMVNNVDCRVIVVIM